MRFFRFFRRLFGTTTVEDQIIIGAECGGDTRSREEILRDIRTVRPSKSGDGGR
jgi:hypothetical protein